VLPRYERITFEKELIAPQGKPLAAFVCPGHPLLDSIIDLTLERHRDVLKRGSILVDERDPSTQPHLLFYLEHTIQDGLQRFLDRVDRRDLSIFQIGLRFIESASLCLSHANRLSSRAQRRF